LRPALILSTLPGPYQNLLICGISTQVQHVQRDWDELIQPSDPDFAQTGLRRASIARLSYLYAADRTEISGGIGQIDPVRLERLLMRLARHLHP
jgi:mRNA interferase MazF